MKVNLTTFEQVHYPVYILEEQRLRNNLKLIASVAREAGVEIILAFKAYALWKTFPAVYQCHHSQFPERGTAGISRVWQPHAHFLTGIYRRRY